MNSDKNRTQMNTDGADFRRSEGGKRRVVVFLSLLSPLPDLRRSAQSAFICVLFLPPCHQRRCVMYDKIVVVTLKTRLEELVERFNTREQAKFYIEHMGLNFADYDREHETYTAAVRQLRRQLEG